MAKIEASGSRLGAWGLELEPLEAKFAKIEASGVKIEPPKPEMRALGPIMGHLG